MEPIVINKNMKTHIVIDMTYHEDEGNQVFVGTEKECHKWVEGQGSFGYKVVPMTKDELLIHNPDVSISKVLTLIEANEKK